MVFKYNYIEGQNIGELTFVKREGSRNKSPYATFKCRCGKEFICQINTAKTLRTKSCGCISKQLQIKNQTKHGYGSSTNKRPEYNSFMAMWSRTTNPKHDNYKRYKELNITVSEEWKTFDVFIKDMGDKPSPLHTIDRIDNTKGYYKENCRWATKKEQQRNKRDTSFAEYKGHIKSIPEWAELCGLSLATIYGRVVQGKWDIGRAITTPSRGVIPKQLLLIN